MESLENENPTNQPLGRVRFTVIILNNLKSQEKLQSMFIYTRSELKVFKLQTQPKAVSGSDISLDKDSLSILDSILSRLPQICLLILILAHHVFKIRCG